MAGRSFQNQQQDFDYEGELLKFLPSDIFPLDQPPTTPPPSSVHSLTNHSSYNSFTKSYAHQADFCMDTHDFAAFSNFIGRSPQPQRRFNNLMSPTNLELFRMSDEPGFRGPLPDRCCVCGECVVGGGNQVHQYGPRAGWPSYGGPVYSFQHRNPVVQTQVQAECFMGERARRGGLQAMPHHSWVNRPAAKNRQLPFGIGIGAGAGVGRGIGGVGGTGVYLPRIPATAANHTDHHHPRRRQVGRRKRDDGAEFMMSMVHKKKQEATIQAQAPAPVAPEECLPEDWTY